MSRAIRGASWSRLVRRLVRLATAGLMAVIAAGLLADSRAADEPADTNSQASQEAGSPANVAAEGITRADLAAAYLRLEQAYFARPLAADEITRVNQGFDQATKAFFLGNNARAIREIDALTESLAGQPHSPAEQALLSLKVTVDPPVWQAGRPVQATCRIASLYEWPSAEPVELDLVVRLVNPAGETAAQLERQIVLGNGRTVDERAPLEVAVDPLSPGQYRVELSAGTDRSITAARVNVIAGATLDAQRAANEHRLAEMKPGAPELAAAVASCRARNQLLSDHPSEKSSAQFLTDLNALASDVSGEVEALESGKNPYRRRPGDYWRVFTAREREIPLRLYVPDAAAGDAKVPLLVVLHGMGGDENMFLEAYGAGVIKQIADRRGLLVASPLTYSFGSDIKTLDGLIEALSRDYVIDRDRVYVLGHSMGAGATAGLARGHAGTIAAACCIAGGGFQAKADAPPILVVSPELDAVVSPQRLQESAQKALSAGMPGELRVMPGYGHTLAVGAILAESVDWLLEHRRSVP